MLDEIYDKHSTPSLIMHTVRTGLCTGSAVASLLIGKHLVLRGHPTASRFGVIMQFLSMEITGLAFVTGANALYGRHQQNKADTPATYGPSLIDSYSLLNETIAEAAATGFNLGLIVVDATNDEGYLSGFGRILAATNLVHSSTRFFSKWNELTYRQRYALRLA